MAPKAAREDPCDITDRDNWHGGYYELAIRLGPRADPAADQRLKAAFTALWADPRLDGCYLEGRRRSKQPRVPADSITPRNVYGLARLPRGGRVVCAAEVIRETEEDAKGDEVPHDWLDLELPLGALGRADRRGGAYPYEDDEPRSMEWRAPLDAWLFEVAQRIYSQAQFVGALIGFEVSGNDLMPEPGRKRGVGYVIPKGDDLMCLPATF